MVVVSKQQPGQQNYNITWWISPLRNSISYQEATFLEKVMLMPSKSKWCSNKSLILNRCFHSTQEANFPFLKVSKFNRHADEEYKKENLCLEILLEETLPQNKPLQNYFYIKKTFKTRCSYSGEFLIQRWKFWAEVTLENYLAYNFVSKIYNWTASPTPILCTSLPRNTFS